MITMGLNPEITEVLVGQRQWAAQQADCLEFLGALPADSIDLCLFSPPYEDCRTYGIDFRLKGQAWVDWMVEVFRACSRVCKGLVACVCEGKTTDRRWTATPVLLMADLHRAGLCLRKPPIYHRVGIPGSGGKKADHAAHGGGADWLRNDYEFVVCAARKGKLPWADGTACGHPPKWAPGGEMSHRLADGARVNQWGNSHGMPTSSPDGTVRTNTVKPSHRFVRAGTKRRRRQGTDVMEDQSYLPPVLANPGNVITCKVGGGLMGHGLAHDNEAPYPLTLAEVFVRSFCRPGGVVCDPFGGSWTTSHAAILWQRRFVGCDIRASQVELAQKRLEGITPMMKCW